MTSYQLLRLRQVEQNRAEAFTDIPLYERGCISPFNKIGPASVAWLESEIDEWINKSYLTDKDAMRRR